MKLTKKDYKLVEKSIKHWNKDIVKPLEGGAKIEKTGMWGGLYWAKKNTKVRCNDTDCALCVEYFLKDCVECPIERFYGRTCGDDGSAFDNFIDMPTLNKAKKMAKSLEAIIKEA